MEIKERHIDVLERETDAKEYIQKYRDIAHFDSLCSECPNYGARWGCPPVADDISRLPERFDKIALTVLKIELEPAQAGSQAELTQAMGQLVRRLRPAYEQTLLEKEKALNGYAALFTGLCPHCGETPCARRSGETCRHPDLVRPSLEALGFDLGRTVSDLFGLELLWARDKTAPPYMCMVGAVFF